MNTFVIGDVTLFHLISPDPIIYFNNVAFLLHADGLIISWFLVGGVPIRIVEVTSPSLSWYRRESTEASFVLPVVIVVPRLRMVSRKWRSRTDDQQENQGNKKDLGHLKWFIWSVEIWLMLCFEQLMGEVI